MIVLGGLNAVGKMAAIVVQPAKLIAQGSPAAATGVSDSDLTALSHTQLIPN